MSLLQEPYKLASFYPKTKDFITSHYQQRYLRITDKKEDEIMDQSIDDYVRELRLSASRSRSNKVFPSYDGRVAEVTYFRISRAMALLKTISPDATSVIDMSAGWGDRLIASMKLGLVYQGYDPHLAMGPIYQRMIRDYNGNAGVESIPFEDAVITRSYEVALTSPPYYDLEVYSSEETQSVNRYSGFVNWMNNFLFPCLSKLANALVENGKMIVHLGDSKHIQMAEAVVMNLLRNRPDLIYQGVVGIGSGNNYRPVWVWQRSSSVGIPRNYFDYYYPAFSGSPIDYSAYNPDIQVIKLSKFVVLSDSHLIGGTKSRAILSMIMHNEKMKRFIYAGPDIGLAHVALARVCRDTGHQCHLLLMSGSTRSPHVELSRSYGATIEIVANSLAVIQQQALSMSTADDYVIPFGLDNVIFIEALADCISGVLARQQIAEPKRCWVIWGSGVLLRVLSQVWRSTQFLVVGVGKAVYSDTFSPSLAERIAGVYTYNDGKKDTNFFSSAKPKPPYESVPQYDAKIWKFAEKYGEQNDYIWNVGV